MVSKLADHSRWSKQSVAALLVGAFAGVGACSSFDEDASSSSGSSGAAVPEAGPGDAAAAGEAGDAGVTPPASIRCGDTVCPSTRKCCLPLEKGDAGCVERSAVCGAGFGELTCSDPTACGAGEVCCVAAERNAGQTGFDIKRAFCVAASACPDQNLQHALCELGVSAHCPGRACKPYTDDVNDLKQNLSVNPTGYATCQ